MPTNHAVDWRTVRLQANPAYELILFDRLHPDEQRALDAVGRDPDGYGVLRPRDLATGNTKFVSRDTALLWLTLQQLGALPRYAVEMLGESCNKTMGQMILDGLLEIESEGRMLSGPAASEIICPPAVIVSADTVVAALSRRALEYGAALDIAVPVTLASRLYDYNRVPASIEWRRRLPDAPAVERFLGLDDGTTARSLRKEWVRLPPQAQSNPWIAWFSGRRSIKPGQTTYKLYISATSSHMRAAVEAAAEILGGCNAFHWKVGADLNGLLRPDKMVAYFLDIADLHQAAELILERLAGCPAQGVPFTSQIGTTALLSSGIDPPVDEFAVPWLQGESWRVRICNRLASTLLLARSTNDTSPASVRFAMNRMRLEGIDPGTWTPTFNPALNAKEREMNA